jgi:hypothetical protein
MTEPCKACGLPVIAAAPSRWGGTPIPFDPEPGMEAHHDTALSADLSHVAISAAAAGNLKGRVPLYRAHQHTCPRKMGIPSGTPLPFMQGYWQAAAGWTGDPIPPPAEDEGLPLPWEGVKVTTRNPADIPALDPPARRLIVAATLALHRVATAVPQSPEARRTAARMRNPQPGDLVTEITSDGGFRGFGILLKRRRERSGEGCGLREARGNDLGSSGDIWYVQYGPDADDVARWDCARFITVLTDDRAVMERAS